MKTATTNSFAYVRRVPIVIFLIFGIALMVRLIVLGALLYSGGESNLIWGDTTRYLALAQNLIDDIGFVHKGVPDAYRPPGYPMFLLPFLAGGLPLWVASIVQIIVASFIPVATYLAAHRYLQLPHRWALFAGVVAAIEPVQVYFSVVLLPEALFASFFLLSLACMVRWLSYHDLRSAIWAGVFLALANYIRPAGLYFPVVVALLFAVYLWWHQLPHRYLLHLCAYMLAFIAILSPWYVRNHLQFGVSDFVSAGSYNLYIYGAASTLALATNRAYEDVNLEFLSDITQKAPEGQNRWSLRNMRFFESRSKEIISEYPLVFVRTYLAGLNNFHFSGTYHFLLSKYGIVHVPERISFSFYVNDNGFGAAFAKFAPLLFTPYFFLAAFGKILWFIFIFGALIGAWINRRNPLAILFVASLAYFCVTTVSVTIGAEARQRYMLNPLIFIFFAACVSVVWTRVRRYAHSE